MERNADETRIHTCQWQRSSLWVYLCLQRALASNARSARCRWRQCPSPGLSLGKRIQTLAAGSASGSLRAPLGATGVPALHAPQGSITAAQQVLSDNTGCAAVQMACGHLRHVVQRELKGQTDGQGLDSASSRHLTGNGPATRRRCRPCRTPAKSHRYCANEWPRLGTGGHPAGRACAGLT